MQFSVRVADYQKNVILNICDAELLGRNIIQDEFNINISKSYYGEKLVEKKEATILLKKSSIINMVGKETISLSIKLGIGSEPKSKTIKPFAVLKILYSE